MQLHETLSAAAADASDLTARVLDMGRAYVHWAITHPDYYQVMFGSELDKTESPEVLEAGLPPSPTCSTRSSNASEAKLMADGDPLVDRRTDLVGCCTGFRHSRSGATSFARRHHREDPKQ